ncbi:hypothetical protein IQ250_03845 [Pseudanabaenaceae cyanobacterium LEGE 13415]|nr:hypothetical protein [Pseudanabaenaceae cyanobacterium LEGE 13415]
MIRYGIWDVDLMRSTITKMAWVGNPSSIAETPVETTRRVVSTSGKRKIHRMGWFQSQHPIYPT